MNNQQVRKGNLITNPFSKRLYTLKEASIYLGRGLHGVRDLVWQGKLPCVRNREDSKGKMWIDIEDLEAFIQKNKETYV